MKKKIILVVLMFMLLITGSAYAEDEMLNLEDALKQGREEAQRVKQAQEIEKKELQKYTGNIRGELARIEKVSYDLTSQRYEWNVKTLNTDEFFVIVPNAPAQPYSDFIFNALGLMFNWRLVYVEINDCNTADPWDDYISHLSY